MPESHTRVSTVSNQICRSLAVIVITSLVTSTSVSRSSTADEGPRFSDYPVPLYQGTIHAPDWMHKDAEGYTRDALEKWVDHPARVNFAGKYFVAVHSCGTSCRYFTLTDLSSGKDVDLLPAEFDTAEPPPRTRDGHTYIVELISQPTSRMLVAQYHVELSLDREECRERVFLFEKGDIKPITKTRYHCREY